MTKKTGVGQAVATIGVIASLAMDEVSELGCGEKCGLARPPRD